MKNNAAHPVEQLLAEYLQSLKKDFTTIDKVLQETIAYLNRAEIRDLSGPMLEDNGEYTGILAALIFARDAVRRKYAMLPQMGETLLQILEHERPR